MGFFLASCAVGIAIYAASVWSIWGMKLPPVIVTIMALPIAVVIVFGSIVAWYIMHPHSTNGLFFAMLGVVGLGITIPLAAGAAIIAPIQRKQ